MVWLAVPVSSLADIMGLEVDGMSLVLSADGFWLALAMVALLGSPRISWQSSAPTGAGASSEPTQGDA